MKLYLSHCRIKDKNVLAICEGLKVNKSLKELHIDKNEIKDVNNISKALKINKTLEKLVLDYFKIKEEKALDEFRKLKPRIELKPKRPRLSSTFDSCLSHF